MEESPGIQNVEHSITASSENAEEEERQTGCAFQCCSPRGMFHRFIALIFMCFLGFGSYFCYDNPGALEDNIKRDLNITTTEYSLLYSMYSWPNVVLCFIGGFLIDRVFGIRLGSTLYMLVLIVGQAIFATGALFDIFWVMVMGRFIFGIGGESLAVAQNNYAVLWFKGKELNMVFGLQLSLARLGSTVNFWVMEPVYKWVQESYKGYEGLGIALFIAGVTCIGSLLCSLILGLMDKRAERILRRNENESGEVVKLTDIRYFPLPFWLLTLVCVAYYSSIFPFIAIGKTFFKERFHLTADEANHINSLVYLVSAFASPILGLLVDKTGKNVFWILLAVASTATAHAILGFSLVTPYVGMIIMGLSYSMLASGLWPLVSFIIAEHQLGTAYGMTQAIQNLGLGVVAILTGYIVDTAGYLWTQIFFLLCLSVAFLCTLAMWFVDLRRDGTLNMTPKQRETHMQRNLEDQERERLIQEENPIPSAHGPHTDFQIRNRYLSRIGAPLPESYRPDQKAIVQPSLR